MKGMRIMSLMRTENKPPRGDDRGKVPADLRDAILLVDKPVGLTSYETVSRVRRITGAARAGHSGTLDRFASGLLVVCCGQSTKLARYLLLDEKRYIGTVKLGVITDTDDREGSVLEERDAGSVTREDILRCSRNFTGELSQVPPRYSALKIRGRRASDRVRGGENVELAPRKVTVYGLDVLDVDLAGARFTMSVRCSKGTYIRSIARDMGSELGTGAYLDALRRTGAGLFSIDDAVTLQELESCAGGHPVHGRFILRQQEALRNYGRIVVSDGVRGRILNGAGFERESALKIDDNGGKTFIILDESENLIAIADMDIGKWQIKYLNVFNTSNNGEKIPGRAAAVIKCRFGA
jgi:tRNA pseudouridine55 synthase